MKKTLLFSLLLVLGLSACGPKPDNPDGAKTTPTEVQILIGEAKEELSMLCEDASDATENDLLLGMIQTFKEQEISWLDTIEEESDAAEAIDLIYEHENVYVEYHFVQAAKNELASYVYGIMDSTSVFEIKQGVYERYDCYRGDWDHVENTFVEVLHLVSTITEDVNEFLEENGYTELHDFGQYIDSVYGYAYSLIYEYGEYLDEGTLLDYTINRLEEFKQMKTEEEAQQLAAALCSDIYNYALKVYKDGLIGAYRNYIEDLLLNITIESAIKAATISNQDDIDAIGGESSFDWAFKTYEASIDVINNDVCTAVRSWAENEIDKIYEENLNKIYSTEFYTEFREEYIVRCAETRYVSSDAYSIEEDVKEIINTFKEFVENILGKISK